MFSEAATASAAAAVRHVVLEVVLDEPVLLAVRRPAEQAAAEVPATGRPD